MGVPVCTKCVGFVQGTNSKMQEWGHWIFPSIQANATEVKPVRIGEMGNHDIDNLECKK